MFSNMRAIYEVYRSGGFTRAANNLYVSQPALSAMVKKTEKKIGMPIFDRSTNPIALTEAGKKYIKTAEKIMNLEEEFSCYVGDVNDLKTGHLEIGGTYLFSAFIVPSILKKFRAEFPNVKVSLHEGATPQLEEKLFAGGLDILIDNYPMDDKIYDKRFLMKEYLLLAVPKEFPGNQGAKTWRMTSEDIKNNRHLNEKMHGVPLKRFEEEPFVVMRSHNDTRERSDEIFKRAGITPKVALKLNQLLTIYHMTENGIGACIVSDTVVKFMPANEELVYYKIADEAAVRNVYMYYRKNRYFTRSMAEFMKIAVAEEENGI